MEAYKRACYVYRHIWSTAVGEVLSFDRTLQKNTEITFVIGCHSLLFETHDVVLLNRPYSCLTDISLESRQEIACGCCHAMVASVSTWHRSSRLYTLLVQPTLLATGHHFRHYAIRHGYSRRRNGKQERSLGVRKPISLLKVQKRAIATHSLLAHRTCQNWMTGKKFRCCFFFGKLFSCVKICGFGKEWKF